jgi:hypothetical protein
MAYVKNVTKMEFARSVCLELPSIKEYVIAIILLNQIMTIINVYADLSSSKDNQGLVKVNE